MSDLVCLPKVTPGSMICVVLWPCVISPRSLRDKNMRLELRVTLQSTAMYRSDLLIAANLPEFPDVSQIVMICHCYRTVSINGVLLEQAYLCNELPHGNVKRAVF